MPIIFLRITRCILFGALTAFYGIFLLHPIQLVNTDIGRHILNGRLLLQSFANWPGVLHTNFYAYTHPDFAVINHHWSSGILFALAEQWGGWAGLHVLFILLSLCAFWLCIDIARRQTSLWLAAATTIMALPFVVQRLEVRPEVFSYLFLAGFLWLLTGVLRGDVPRKWLAALPVLQLLWANLHVYFPLGVFLIGIFGIPALCRKDWPLFTRLFIIGVLSALASLCTPFGLAGALYPFQILQNYGYEIVENQTVWFLEQWGLEQISFTLLRAWSVLLGLGLLQSLLQKKWRNTTEVPLLLFGIVCAGLAWFALRNFTLFGLVLIPTGAVVLHNAWQFIEKDIPEDAKLATILGTCLLGIAITTFMHWPNTVQAWRIKNIGLQANSLRALHFIQEQDITGPILNNYDNGGYLLYGLYPEEKVFVDNRPEAYPVAFFTEVYIPMQEQNTVWENTLQTYNFNAIIFYYRDHTPWAQKFLQARVKDNTWIAVYADNSQIIFLRNIEKNASTIAQYALDANRLVWK